MKHLTILALITLIIFSSCNNKFEEELELLQVYLDENNIDAEPTQTGLYYIETYEGNGSYPAPGSTVTVHYEGRLLDGEIFDSSLEGEPFSFTLGAGQVISGWDEGIAYMRNGGRATLIIPSDLAYGADGSGSIPEYSTLIFNVELLSIF